MEHLLPAVLAARLLGCTVEELEWLASAGLVLHERRPMRAGGLVAVPRVLA